jgi:hypothetical protein
MTGGFASSAASKNVGNTGMKPLMKPTAKGPSVVVRMCAISFSSSQSVCFCGWRPPKLPSAPAFETAAASVPPQCNAIGADMIGYVSPNISVKRVVIIDAHLSAARTDG